MEEKVRFVWEQTIKTDVWDAKKIQKYEEMKKLYENMKNTIKRLQQIKELSRLAGEYGVFRFETEWSSAYTVKFITADLIVDERFLVKKLYGEELEGKNSTERYKFYKELGWEQILDDIIAYQERELEKMKQYLKEAEKYLTVSVEP